MAVTKIQTNKPMLILLYGFPGAGKTHFAHNMTRYMNCAHVHSDRIRHELFEEPRHDKQEDQIIAHLMNYMAEEFLNAGISVIYDTTMSRKTDRNTMRELARKKQAKTLLVWFQIDPDTSYARLRKRDRRKIEDKYAQKYNEVTFREYASKMQHPEPTEDYVVVSGKHTIDSQRSSLTKKLMEMGLVNLDAAQASVAKPGMVNLIPQSSGGRVDRTRRNINIR
jgi:predicted kinase